MGYFYLILFRNIQKGLGKHVMKKKVFAILLIIMMVVATVPASVFSATLPTYFDDYTDIYPSLIKDEKFAKVVFAEISPAITSDSYDVSAYSSAAAILENYNPRVSLNAADKGIVDITGINGIQAGINLEFNLIEDISPLNAESWAYPINFNSNPIHYWPATLPNINKSSNTYSIPTAWSSSGKAVYIDDGAPKIQTILFDVTRADTAGLWQINDSQETQMDDWTRYTGSGGATFQTTPATDATSASIKVTGNGSATAHAVMKTFYYNTIAGEVTQGNTPVYNYVLDDVFYNMLKVQYDLKNPVSFQLVKYKEGTKDTVAGAVYGIYSDPECTKEIKEVMTQSTPVTIDGLTAGTYYIKEKTPAAGYNLNDKVTPVILTGATYSLDAQGTKQLTGITPDTSSWKNNWTSDYDMASLDLELQEDPLTVSVSDYEDAVLFIGGDPSKTVDKFQLVLGEGQTFTGTVTISYEGATSPVVMAENDTAVGDIADRINGYIADNLGNLTVTYTGTINGAEARVPLVEVTDTHVTIWVENTTGSSYGTPKFPENAGGEVYICSRTEYDDPEASVVEGTRSKISSDGADNNNNRKENYCACGQAAEGWFVATDKILIGAKDARDNGGAGYVNIGANGKGPFTVKLTDRYGVEHTVTGIVDWNDDMTQACVFIDPVTFTLDIDIAIPFWTPEPVPSTGVSATILAWAMIALAMVYAIISVRKARKEA